MAKYKIENYNQFRNILKAGEITVTQLCEYLRVSRTLYYHWFVRGKLIDQVYFNEIISLLRVDPGLTGIVRTDNLPKFPVLHNWKTSGCPQPSKKVCSTKDLMALFNCADSTVRRWKRDYDLPYMQFTEQGALRFHWPDVQKWALEKAKEIIE